MPAHWFKKRIGAALGIMALGSSCGGTLYPIVVRNLMQSVGYVSPLISSATHRTGLTQPLCRFQWTMRILGFIQIFLLGFEFVVRRSSSSSPPFY